MASPLANTQTAPAKTQTKKADPYDIANKEFEALAKKYGLQLCGKKKQAEGEDPLCENHQYFYSELEAGCKSPKEKAKACCQDPGSCTNLATELATGALVLAPTVKGIVDQYKVKKKVSRDTSLTRQEKSDKMCNANNKALMGVFYSALLKQLIPVFQKNCADRIKKCKKTCDSLVTEFKQDLRQIYNMVIQAYNIENTFKMAKGCLYGSEETPFEDISFQDLTNARPHSFKVGEKILEANGNDESQCGWNALTQKKEDHPRSDQFFAQVLFYAKAYHNTMKKKEETFVFNEKEIIDCAEIPDRVVDTNNKTAFGGPISQPVLQACEQVTQELSGRPLGGSTPTAPKMNTENVLGGPSAIGSLSANDHKREGHPLIPGDANKEDENLQAPGDGFPLGKNTPSLSKNLPGFKNGGNPGGSLAGGVSPGGGAGGGGPSGSGEEGGEFYGDSSDIGSFGGGFPGGNYGDSAYPQDLEGAGGGLGRETAGEDEDDEEGIAGFDGEGDDFEDINSDGSIFEMASEKIQSFCSNLKCSF